MKKISILLIALLSVTISFTQENLSFQKPPQEILQLVDYERAPQVIMDSKKENMIFLYRDTYKTLDDLNQDELKLAGLRINPITNISSTITYINNLKIRKLKGDKEIQVNGLPVNPKIANLSWSPDEKIIAFTHTTNNAVELWVLDLISNSARKVSNLALNANLGNPISWFKDGKKILVRAIPSDRPALINTQKSLPNGPIVTNSDGSKAQNRTYQDLLKNPIDEQNFETIASSELFAVTLDGKTEKWMKKAMYASESFSPDGNYILITTI